MMKNKWFMFWMKPWRSESFQPKGGYRYLFKYLLVTGQNKGCSKPQDKDRLWNWIPDRQGNSWHGCPALNRSCCVNYWEFPVKNIRSKFMSSIPFLHQIIPAFPRLIIVPKNAIDTKHLNSSATLNVKRFKLIRAHLIDLWRHKLCFLIQHIKKAKTLYIYAFCYVAASKSPICNFSKKVTVVKHHIHLLRAPVLTHKLLFSCLLLLVIIFGKYQCLDWLLLYCESGRVWSVKICKCLQLTMQKSKQWGLWNYLLGLRDRILSR